MTSTRMRTSYGRIRRAMREYCHAMPHVAMGSTERRALTAHPQQKEQKRHTTRSLLVNGCSGCTVQMLMSGCRFRT